MDIKNMSLMRELILLIMWIGLWGVVENIVDKFIPFDNHNARIILFSIIFLLSIIIVYQMKNKNNNKNNNRYHTNKKNEFITIY